MSQNEQRTNGLTKIIVFISAAAILCNYYYLYFVNFMEGESEGGSYSILKIAGILIACAALLRPAIRKMYTQGEFALLILIILSLTIFSLKSFALGLSDTMFLNFVICLLPLITLKWKNTDKRAILFLESCLFVMTLQVLLDSYIYLSGYSIWENKAFIGGLGNPSSFGLVCNLLITYILFKRKPRVSSLLYAAALSAGVLMTSSMLSSIALGIVYFAWAFKKLSLKKFAILLIGFIATPFVVMNFASDHLIYKINSAANIFDSASSGDSSRSVSLRLEIHKVYLDNLEREPIQGILYGFDESSYMKYDSQILTYASSFGLLYSIVFFATITLFMARAAVNGDYFIAISMLLFAITFATNRILDYYPMPFFLGLLIVMSNNGKNIVIERALQRRDAPSA